ncbi:hypothetical protein F5B19DRAFT_442655 [Rostrohypoxylon terebratum]|nr:hypothetical protein F5B19DRAFT_442655 [Rostrohypoxylon terebratum]
MVLVLCIIYNGLSPSSRKSLLSCYSLTSYIPILLYSLSLPSIGTPYAICLKPLHSLSLTSTIYTPNASIRTPHPSFLRKSIQQQQLYTNMLVVSFMLLAWLGLFALAQEKPTHVRVSVVHKREMITCEEMYGKGSKTCGAPDSTYCFNPSSGQSCCAVDNGFCDAGKYCAPVGGYCCFEGEDLETCAQNAGFTLPASISNLSSVATNTAAGSPTVSPFLKGSSVPASIDIQNCGSPEPAAAIANSTAATVPTATARINTSNPTALVQISFARRRADPMAGPMVMVGIISLMTILI